MFLSCKKYVWATTCIILLSGNKMVGIPNTLPQTPCFWGNIHKQNTFKMGREEERPLPEERCRKRKSQHYFILSSSELSQQCCTYNEKQSWCLPLFCTLYFQNWSNVARWLEHKYFVRISYTSTSGKVKLGDAHNPRVQYITPVTKTWNLC